MEPVVIPPAWVDAHAPVANLLAPLHPHWPWWAAAVLLSALALLLHHRSTRPRTAPFERPSDRPTSPASPVTPSTAARTRAGSQWAGVVIAAAAAFALAVACDGLVDDAYIQFRYAANWAAGVGPVFNPGERLEGASGGGWIATLAATSRLTGLSEGVAGRLLSLLLAPAAVVVAGFTAARLAPGAAVPVAVAWAALATPALYAASGLETACWALALWLLAAGLAAARPGPAAAGAVIAAAVRPEALVLAAFTLPTWRRLPRAGRTALAAAAVTLVTLAAARFLYYGSPVPHAALVKGVTAAAGPGAGGRYLLTALLEWWPLLLALPALWQRRRHLLPVLLPVGGWTALAVARGGDWMPGSRYLIPLLVLLTVALAMAPARLCLATAALLVAVAAWRLAPLEFPGRGLPGDLWRAMTNHRVQSRWWEALGERLGRQLPADTLLAVGPAGALAYASRLPVFDLYGLNTPVRRRGGVTPGHTLWGLPEAIQRACAVIVPGRPVPQSNDPAALHAAAAEFARQTPELASAYRPVLLVHPSQRRLDIVRDIIWVRQPPPTDGPS